MSKELFDNVGKELKSFATVIANIILGTFIVLGGIVLIIGFSIGDAAGFIGLLIAICLFVFGYVYSRLKVMLLYAYGEIADRLISIDTKMPECVKHNKPEKMPVKTVEKKSENKGLRKESGWECSFCGSQNPADAKFCKTCGIENVDI